MSKSQIYAKQSFKACKECINLTVEKQINDSVEIINISPLIFDKNLDHTKLSMECPYPYNNLIIEINDKEWMETFGGEQSIHKISIEAHPDALGKVILDEVWKQFGNQIGLDMTNETLIQKYDREHPVH